MGRVARAATRSTARAAATGTCFSRRIAVRRSPGIPCAPRAPGGDSSSSVTTSPSSRRFAKASHPEPGSSMSDAEKALSSPPSVEMSSTATCGIDLSAAALDLAARADPLTTWVVANADRGLPLMSRSCDVVLSITARRPAAEIRRVLENSGDLWVAVPGADDLAELREMVEGQGERTRSGRKRSSRARGRVLAFLSAARRAGSRTRSRGPRRPARRQLSHRARAPGPPGALEPATACE